jgi:hypothetical protein
LPLYFKNKEQNAPRFGIGAGSQLGAHCVRWAGMTDYQGHKKVRDGEHILPPALFHDIIFFKYAICFRNSRIGIAGRPPTD